MSKVDFLTEDSLVPENQKFVCLSFLTDKENKTTLCGIKIRGVFDTYEKACEHAKKLQTVDQYFNVFVGDMGKWLPFDPAPDSKAVQDSEYANEQLNNMMKAYYENQEKAKIYHEQRKNEMVRQNILDNLNTRRDNLKEAKKKLKKAKTTEEEVSLKSSVEAIEDQIKKMETRKTELDEQLEQLSEQMKSFKPSQLAPPKIVEDN